MRTLVAPFLFVAIAASNAFATTGVKQNPLEKYLGAYADAWSVCSAIQKQVFASENAKSIGIALSSDAEKTKADVSQCIQSGLIEMKKKHNDIPPFVSSREGKKALQEHYVAAVTHVKGTHALPQEDEMTFAKRMNETKGQTDALWVKFAATLSPASDVYTNDAPVDYINLETGLKFPSQVMEWSRSRVKILQSKTAGTQIDYSRPGFGKASIYIYHAGVANIPTGADSEVVQQEFARVQKEIMNFGNSGESGNVQMIMNSPQIITTDNGAAKMLVAMFRTTEPRYQPEPMMSWFALTGYKGHYLKMHFSFFDANKIEDGQREFNALINELMEVNKPTEHVVQF